MQPASRSSEVTAPEGRQHQPSRERGRGRPRSFDTDEAAAAVLAVLWRQGYDATSIEDLVTATGLSSSSLYGAFGNKQGLLQAALTRYDRDMDALLGPLADGQAGLADVAGLLDRVRPYLAAPNGSGCFMVNTMTEVSPRDPDIAALTRRYRERIREALRTALARAADRGEIDASTVDDRARVVQVGLFGAHVAARAGSPDDALAAIDALQREIERWT